MSMATHASIPVALLAAALASVPAPAFAQSGHAHHMPAPAPAPKAKPAPKPKAKPKPKPAAAQAPGKASAHAHHAPPTPTLPPDEPTPHARHDAAPDVAGHAAHGAAHDPVPTFTPVPPPTDADRAAALPPAGGHAAHGDGLHWLVTVDELEAWRSDGDDALAWDLHAWIGGDINRLWLRTEGEQRDGATEHAELELLYGRAISPWWTLLAGARVARGGEVAAAVGVEGLAPYKIEVEATAYLEDGGDLSARVELGYDTLFTQRLILRSNLELEARARGDAGNGLGAGLSKAEAGLRLRYELTRRVAPYVGLVHERAVGPTADLRRAAGESASDTRIVLGIHAWF
jgi:copper resistance protein B